MIGFYSNQNTMLLNQMLAVLQKHNNLSVSITGRYAESAAALCLRHYDPQALSPDTLYIVTEEPEMAHLHTGFFLCLNPSHPVTSDQIVTIYSDASPSQLFNAVQFIFERNMDVSVHFHTLFAIANRTETAAEFLEAIRPLVKNELCLISSSFYVVESTFPFTGMKYLLEQKQARQYLSPDTIAHIKKTGLLEKMLHADTALYIDDPYFTYPLIIASIKAGDYVTGYLFIIQNTYPTGRHDLALADFIAELMSQNLYKNSSHLTARAFDDEYFLQTILHPDGQNVPVLARIMDWTDMMNYQYYQLLLCTLPNVPEHKSTTHFSRQLRHLFPDSPILIEEHGAVILLAGSCYDLLSARMCDSLNQLLDMHQLYGITSFPFPDISLAASYYSYSRTLLSDTILQYPQGNELHHMEDHYFHILLHIYKKNTDDHILIHPNIRFLQRYDQQHGSELTLTLKTYIECNRNIKAMSEQLHINKSTGFYRINQIKELLGDPFASSDKLFAYECSFRLMGENGRS